MDIVEYVERIWDIKLLEYQKALLRKFAELPEEKRMSIRYGICPWPCLEKEPEIIKKREQDDV